MIFIPGRWEKSAVWWRETRATGDLRALTGERAEETEAGPEAWLQSHEAAGDGLKEEKESEAGESTE
jgi:hypothetical protein